jgi:hypothetical protein
VLGAALTASTAVLFLFRFIFTLFPFRFASDFYVSHQCETNNNKTFFGTKQKKFCFRFASLRFEAKMTAVSLLFCFVFALFFVSLQISMFRIDAKQAKKNIQNAFQSLA